MKFVNSIAAITTAMCLSGAAFAAATTPVAKPTVKIVKPTVTKPAVTPPVKVTPPAKPVIVAKPVIATKIAKPVAAAGHMVTTKTTTGKTITYNCSKAGNANKKACK